MNQRLLRSAIAAMTAVLAVSPRAQAPTDAFSLRAEGRAACAPIHTKPADEGQPHGLWASGDDYKVSFDGGMQFVPYVGRDVLASPAFRWHTSSARLGELELATAPARLTHGEWRAEYDLGGIVEAYDVHAAGVEQTFVLRERPAAHGDLVIRGAVASLLRAKADARGSGVTFVDDAGRARVHYGAATAIDAAGHRRAMTTTVVDGGLELRLDAAWLETASFPLVVDPLIAPVQVENGMSITEVATAHEPLGTKNVWYATVRYVGADADLRLYRTDESGLNPILVFADISASWSSIEPSLGVSRPGASTVLAFTRNVFVGDTRRVRLHVHDRLDLGFANSLVYLGSDGRNHWRPAVGHELSPVSFSSVLLAYQVEGYGAFTNGLDSAIHGAEIDCGGDGSVTAQFTIAEAPLSDFERPVVSKVAVGPSRVWTVGYQRYLHFGPDGFDWDVVLRRVAQGNVVGAEFPIDTATPAQHEMAPKLGGTDDRLMVFATASTIAESVQKPQTTNGHRIRGTRIDWDGASFVAPHGSKTLQQNGDARLELGGVDFDTHSRSHWALCFRSNVTQTVYLRTYGFRGDELTSDTIETPVTGLGTSIGGSVTFEANGHEFLVGYGIDEPGVGSYARLRRKTYSPLIPVSATGLGCASTQIGWFGQRHIGNETCGVTFANAPLNSFTVVLIASGTEAVQLNGIDGVHDGCWLLVPIDGPGYFFMLDPILATGGQWSLPLPEDLPNMTLRFQGLTFDATLGEFFTTNRINVPVAK